MSEFYDEMAEVAEEMITEFGFALQVKPEPVASDPVTGAPAPSNPPVDTFGVQIELEQKQFPETPIRSTDKMLLIHTEVLEGQVVILPDGDWTVLRSSILKPDNETQLLSTVLLRG